MKPRPPSSTLTPEAIRKRVLSLGKWFHNLNLMGVQTAPDHFLGDYPSNKWHRFEHALPSDLSGKSVLDIGCNAGFYSMEMKRRGAERVVGIDHDEEYLAQARFASEVTGLDIEYLRMSVYETASLRERFDLVLFMGVFYHLRYPLLAMDLLHEHVARNLFVFQSMLRGAETVHPARDDYPFSEEGVFNEPGFPKLHFIEKSYTGDPTNWWIPNRACVEAMLRTSGFEILDHPETEVYVCRRLDRKDEFSGLPPGGIACG